MVKWRAVASFALGCGLGAVLPISREPPEPSAVDAPEEPTSEPVVPDQASAGSTPEIEAFADPCLGVRAAERRVQEISAQVERARAFFDHRFGERIPAPPDFDPDAEVARYGEALAAYPDQVWSTVDCTLYPCVGLVLVDRPQPVMMTQDLARDVVGLPDAWVVPETQIVEGRSVDLVVIGLTDVPLELPQRRWHGSLAQYAKQKYGPALRDAKEALVETWR